MTIAVDRESICIFPDVGGVLSVLFGLLVMIAPGAGALGLIWVIASYSILFGILFIGLALRLRKHSHPAALRTAA